VEKDHIYLEGGQFDEFVSINTFLFEEDEDVEEEMGEKEKGNQH
jgi:hypothetical protein